ncbi:hypothetical protein D1007_40268 [Hordeum vulgare]|nr:hypothetical protein D1007_40268 [Hordeum vulgare]
MVKINTDVACFERNGTGGWGLICRDAARDVHFAAGGPSWSLSDALHVEALALCQAIEMADRLGVGRVMFETDCLVLQKATSSCTFDFATLGVLLSDIRFKLRTRFIEAIVVYAPRTCSKPAHVLTSMGAGLADGEQREWFTTYPHEVISLLTGDQAGS